MANHCEGCFERFDDPSVHACDELREGEARAKPLTGVDGLWHKRLSRSFALPGAPVSREDAAEVHQSFSRTKTNRRNGTSDCSRVWYFFK